MVYKPHVGEQPLWDFPADTLAIRETLAYEVSDVMRLDVVPETVLAEGPYGAGSVQRYVEADPEFDVVDAVRSDDGRLWPIALLDIVTNNADRKLGHILEVDGRLIGIDHGLTFHPHDKLRTVLWALAGRCIPDELGSSLRILQEAIREELGERIALLLGEEERVATSGRVDRLVETGVHPSPPVDRPPLPWPLY